MTMPTDDTKTMKVTANITSTTVDKSSLSTAKMPIATTRNTNKDTRGIILKKLFRALVNLVRVFN